MKIVLAVVCLFLGCCQASFFKKALGNIGHTIEKAGKKLDGNIHLDRIVPISDKDVLNLVENGFDGDFKVKYTDHATFRAFSFDSCASSYDPVQVTNFTLAPDPIHLPGNVQLGFDVSVKKDIGQSQVDLDVHMKMKQKVLGWIDIPCIDQMGSCNYKDVCSKATGKTCPPILTKYGIPCKCPISSGKYSLPVSSFDIKNIKIPSLAKDGEFKVNAKFSSNGKQITCVNVGFTLG